MRDLSERIRLLGESEMELNFRIRRVDSSVLEIVHRIDELSRTQHINQFAVLDHAHHIKQKQAEYEQKNNEGLKWINQHKAHLHDLM